MSEFDEIATVRRIIALCYERLQERTEADIKKFADAICRKHRCSAQKAYEMIEADLLDNPPKSAQEKWD